MFGEDSLFKNNVNSLVGSITIHQKESKVEFDVLWKDDVVANVLIDFTKQKARVFQYTDDFLIKPFSKDSQNVSISDVLDFLEDRCFPRERVNCNEVLKELGLSFYKPLDIVRKTHGVQFDDFMWVRFKGETLKHADVKIRD